MIKKTFVLLVLIIYLSFFLISATNAFADIKGVGDICNPTEDTCVPATYSCLQYDPKTYLCLSGILGAGEKCNSGNFGTKCISGYSCQFDDISKTELCMKSSAASIFGKIQLPDALKNFIGNDPTGAGAISRFLSNGIILIYSIAAVVLIFMLLWGAFEWLVSGGDKEKIQSAQKKILNAFVGIILFAIAFAVIQVLGQFTGFKFFIGQK